MSTPPTPPPSPPPNPNPPPDPDVVTTKELVSLGASLWRIFKGTMESAAFIAANYLISELLKGTQQDKDWMAIWMNNGLTFLAAVTAVVTLGVECYGLIWSKIQVVRRMQGATP